MFNLSDEGNGQLYATRYWNKVRWVEKWSSWIIWDGTRWRIDEFREYRQLYTDFIQAMIDGCEKLGLDPGDKVLKWYYGSRSESRTRAALNKAQDNLCVSPASLDSDPWLLNCPNGVVDLRTGELRPHDPELLMMKQTRVQYHPEAGADRFLRFLERIQPNPEVRDWIQRHIGYSLTGMMREEIFPIWWGTGNNGKSTLHGLFQRVLGDYACSLSAGVLIERNYDEHPTALVDLFGARFAVASEVPDGSLNEAMVKRIASRDRMKARRMRQDFFEWEPTHKAILTTNTKPRIKAGNKGIWRRIVLVPFEVDIPEDELDLTLEESLFEEEGPGILVWMVQGCLEWRKRRLLDLPPTLQRAKEEYREEEDQIGKFLREACIVNPEFTEKVPVSAVYDHYETWCVFAKERPMTKRTFGVALREHGLAPSKSGSVRYYTGLQLKGFFSGEK